MMSRIRPAWWGVAFLGLVTLFVTQTQSQVEVYSLNTILLAVLGAVALNLLMGTAGQPSVGNAAFLAVGAFIEVFLIRQGSIPFPVSVLVAALASAAIGLVIGLPAARLQGLYLALATLGAHFIVIFVVNRYQSGAGATGGFILTPTFIEYGLAEGQRYWAYTLFAVVAAVILAASRLMRERSGRAWRLIREHEHVAAAFGIHATRYKLAVFALSSGLIGLQGALLAHFTGSVTVEQFTLHLSIAYIAMILIGGPDSLAGAVIGAAIVTYIPVKIPDIVAGFMSANDAAAKGSNIATILYGVLIVVFVIGSSRGIVGWFENLRASRLAGLRARLGRKEA